MCQTFTWMVCKVCSAEGNKLFEDCQGPFVSWVFYFKDMTKEEFEKKYQTAIDEGNKTAK